MTRQVVMLPLGSAGGFQVMKIPPSRICPCNSRGSEGTVKAVGTSQIQAHNKIETESRRSQHTHTITTCLTQLERFRVFISYVDVGFFYLFLSFSVKTLSMTLPFNPQSNLPPLPFSLFSSASLTLSFPALAFGPQFPLPCPLTLSFTSPALGPQFPFLCPLTPVSSVFGPSSAL